MVLMPLGGSEMAVLSHFGKILRKLRIDRDLKLFDLAEAMGVTSAYVSSIEGGRKTINDALIDKVSRALAKIGCGLTEIEIDELRVAMARDAKEVRIDTSQASGRARELALTFARNFNALDDKQLEAIVAHLTKKPKDERSRI